MRPTPCVVSVAEHTGWAHLICVAAHANVPAVVGRRRVALVDKGLPTMPYEHDTTALRPDEANAVIAKVRRSIAARSLEALRRTVTDLSPAHLVVALAIRKPPFDGLPKSVADVRTSYRLLCAADGMLYQLAICRAARQLELDVYMCRRGQETALAAEKVGASPGEMEAFVSRGGRPAGPPWTREHCRAYAAGIAALAAHSRLRLRIPTP